ncbi:hypothetical protein FQK02_13840 [Xanthomonas vasicola]|uniref:hypothetical protein n=1 Tax=Xanthomonas vasicola TaxID=56459 RepID=UPI0001CBEEDA|nr:hypothetical protein [Xanthomonas vasicola]KFA27618.1 hypothetical protein KWG_0121200 [Xanthomonas vasicola pv. vasculorum NCPPB 1381]KFA30484.1 hypothetical protein KW5_0104460 [Xanthomonas vasicola pv. vasculorum NCPPB 1326]MDO6970940.1 hypothetical protein [Xanthomonas vasicola]TWQ09703.1 hypothetical protein FQK02_13840 [Xanthomonas vasicola]
MSIPAQAFADRLPNDLTPGSLFLFRESWALLVNNQQEEPEPVLAFLMLQGERAGSLFKVGEGMTRCLTLVEPFGWFASVEEDVLPAHDGVDTASLSLTSSGPVIVGQLPSNWGDGDKIAFGMDGQPLGGYPRGAVRRFAKWSAELCHPSRPFVSLGRIFEVNRVPN